jgi:hypothetical protein
VPASLKRLVNFTWSISYLAIWAILISSVTLSCKSLPLNGGYKEVINRCNASNCETYRTTCCPSVFV